MTDNLRKMADQVETPCHVVDMGKLRANLMVAERIRHEADCKILLATKAFALPAVFPLMSHYLDGTTASGLYEARLGREEFGKEVHAYAPAYKEHEFEALLDFADHIYFNSPGQLALFGDKAKIRNKKIGLRINPAFSSANVGGDLYNPCAPCSRFGTLPEDFKFVNWDQIDVLHAHVLCEAGHLGSVGLIEHLAKNFSEPLKRVKAVNFGGGHFFNKPDYDVGALIKALQTFHQQFSHLELILEPGGALVYNAGFIVASVLDIHHNEKDIAILDVSASCHMPDILEADLVQPLIGAEGEGVLAHSYILAGSTCMTGDVIGTYSFAEPLHGASRDRKASRLIFGDGLQYCFVKNTTFNGTPLPNYYLMHERGHLERLSNFSYNDFRSRLGKSVTLSGKSVTS